MATVLAIQAHQEPYISGFFTRPAGRALYALRRAAIERFAALGFPTTKLEDWKYTNLAPWLKVAYEPAPRWEADGYSHSGGPALVFMNGWFVPEVSSAPAGVQFRPLSEVLDQAPVARCAAFDNNALVALNTALFEDGAYIAISDGAVIEEPVSLVFATTAGQPVSTYPRVLIAAGRDAQARIVEYYLGEGSYFTSAVTELSAGEGAVLEHYKVQQESAEALHFHHLAAHQARSSSLASFNIALGGGMARNEIVSVLDGEGAHCALNGLYVITGKQHVDNHTTLDHAQPHATSHELYKGVLDGHSEAVFHGRIIVRQPAQKTDAIQRNRNLLLSKDAVINTKPQLEIYADDVRCTHGATVGQVDDDAVFYLRSRGIALEDARNLLTYAFASEITDQIKVAAVRSQLADALFRQLASGPRPSGSGAL